MWWVMMGFALVAGLVAVLPVTGKPALRILWIVFSLASASTLVVQSATRESAVSDRGVYMRDFYVLDEAATPWSYWHLLSSSQDPGFAIAAWGLTKFIPVEEAWVFGAVGAILAAMLTIAFRLLMPWWGVALCWFTSLHMGLALAYSTVAIRHGLALGCMLVAAALYVRAGRLGWLGIALSLIAMTLHWSAIAFAVVVFLLAVTTGRLNIRVMWAGWWLLVGMFASGTHSLLLSPLARHMPQLDVYTSAAALSNSGGGYRIVFLGSILALGCLAWLGTRLDASELQERLVRLYLAWSSIYLMFGFVAFSDRLAAWAWFLAPILLWRPISHWVTVRREGRAAAIGAVLLLASWGAATA